uniref:Uncharacterized protein n=1 Tax=Anguilla anguilla TaxID=7936 RepID=A0A0E9SAL6_ANGAN
MPHQNKQPQAQETTGRNSPSMRHKVSDCNIVPFTLQNNPPRYTPQIHN